MRRDLVDLIFSLYFALFFYFNISSNSELFCHIAIHTMLDTIWTDSFWFPSNITWNDLESEPADGRYHPRAKDLLISIPIAFILIGVRFVVER